MSVPRIPRATYRVQFREAMDFARAAKLAPYWQRLGVSHLYASPIFQATRGSTHGYDVTDHGSLDAGLGDFAPLHEALATHDLGLVLDIVPNHMAASLENPWYRDVLRHGEASRYARHFDIDWSAPKLLLTTLGRPYGEVLAKDEFGLTRLADGPAFTVYDKAIPLDPATWELVFHDLDLHPALPSATHPQARTEWFERAARSDAPAIDAHLAKLARSRERLHAIHEAQPWRLTYWRAARDTLTHRRFFEITDLIGVRVEDEVVFDDVHRLIFEMVERGEVHGLRVDHVDGLADPGGYLEQLREKLPAGPDGAKVPVWIEKILGPGERLPDAWPTEGTTGYEVASWIAGALVDPAGEEPLTEAYDAFTGTEHDYDAMLEEAKREIVTRNLAAELRLLTQLAFRIAADDPTARDYGFDTLRRAILSLASAMRVYRSYLAGGPASERDAAILDAIAKRAGGSIEVEDAGTIGFVIDLLKRAPDPRDPTAPDHERFRRRFQQTTGALMAKALEDTLFYRYHRLVALNEVGGEPDAFAISPETFHREIEARAANQPHGITSTATHDTKRGEDARMRQAAISHHARHWTGCVERWDEELAGEQAPEREIPEPEMRWLFYQALLGAWEGTRENLAERLATYLVKAAREAKGETSWVRSDEEYEATLEAFAHRALARAGNGDFLDRFLADCAPIIETGERLALQQVALHLTLPGVPDIYQGTERGDFSLVDPDNRRPPDFERIGRGPEGETFAGRKQRLLETLLDLRRDNAALFEHGAYTPLDGLAFLREHEGQRLLVAIGAAPDMPGDWEEIAASDAVTLRLQRA